MSPARPPAARLTTRVLLITAAFGALGALLLILVAPLTSTLAALFPPAYAVAAGIHSVLPFLARRLLGVPGTAALVGLFVGVLSVGFTPLGLLIVVPLVVAGGGYDLTLLLLRRRGPLRERHHLVAATVTAVLLFLVSLPVMSPEHLVPWMLALTLAGRLVGQLGASALAGLLASRVLRAGIMGAAAREGS